MKSRNICERIVRNFFDTPVIVENRRCSSVQLDMNMRKDGIIVSAEPIRFAIAIDSESDVIMVNYLPKQLKQVADLYHPKLIGILHEIGHAYTMVGTNYKRNSRRKKRIAHDDRVTYKRANEIYRQIEDESRADQWAIQWLIDNPNLALEWSNKLCEEFVY